MKATIALRLALLVVVLPVSGRAQSPREAPASAEAHYLKGLSLARGPEVRVPAPGGMLDGLVVGQVLAEILHLDPVSRARRAFLNALELDSLFAPAAVELGRLALATHDRNALAEAARPLERLHAYDPGNSVVALTLSGVSEELGELESAERAARQALTAGADRSLALRALAAALLRQAGRELDGASNYQAGAERADSIAAEAYFADIAPIATAEEKSRWRSGTLAERRAMLAGFWDMRAALSGVTAAERLAEHYRRLAVANERYRRLSRRGAPAQNALLWLPASMRSPFDDRGMIYLRYGEPAQRVHTTGYSNPNESWVYYSPDRSVQLYDFVKLSGLEEGGSTADYVLLGNLPCDADWLSDRSAFVPQYAHLGARCDNLRSLERDAHAPSFTERLPFYYNLYTFRGTAGRTLVTAALAIPGDALTPVPEQSAVRYAVSLSLILADTSAQRVLRVDTTLAITSRRLRPDESLRAPLELLVAPAGSMTHRLVALDAAAPKRGRFSGSPLDVPDYSGTKLMISDLVLAAPGGGTWQRGQVRLSLVPLAQFPAGAPFALYYEIYNLPEAEPYRTDVRIEAVTGAAGKIKSFLGGKRALRFSFNGQAAVHDVAGVQELRQLQSQLPPGRYRVHVAVTRLATGAATSGEREFEVVGPR
jgi:GWxTD domain-containing protein